MSAEQTVNDEQDQLSHEQLAGLVHAFISMMQAGNIARMDLDYHDLRLSLRAHELGAPAGVLVQHQPAGTPPVVESAPVAVRRADHHIITAPMIGTFYTAPAPNEPVFVEPGDRVEEGQTIGIIEAMKIMNEIAADHAGIVVEIVAENAQSVEFGSPLIVIEPLGE